MDESLLELENELKRLTPRRPSRDLRAALERELAPCPMPAEAPRQAVRPATATSLRSWKWVLWSFAGAVAAVALTLVLRSTFDRTKTPAGTPETARQEPVPVANALAEPASPDRYEPVLATSVLYALQESPPTTLPDRSVGREVRYRFVDTYTWKNPARNASVRWSVPRDEVRLVRANLD